MANDIISSIKEQYEKNKQIGSGQSKFSQDERLKKYFTTVLPKGKTSMEKRIRILPTKDGSSPFVQVRFHEILVDNKWVKLFDPEQEGKRSPLNEVRRSLLATGKEDDKKLAQNYLSRTFYIVKVVDRDNENDGVKFWRFKHNSKNEGIYDKMFPIFLNKGDITDPNKGRDLVLYLALSRANNGKDYTIINSVIPEDISPLHEDKETSDKWVNDATIWSDVYSKKGEDYLELVAEGETPYWDTKSNKWIPKDSVEEETLGAKDENSLPEDPQMNDVPDEDLPF